jgi:hypothetical protein
LLIGIIEQSVFEYMGGQTKTKNAKNILNSQEPVLSTCGSNEDFAISTIEKISHSIVLHFYSKWLSDE